MTFAEFAAIGSLIFAARVMPEEHAVYWCVGLAVIQVVVLIASAFTH